MNLYKSRFKLIFFVFISFINLLNSQQTNQEDLILLEAKNRNIQTQEEALIELNKGVHTLQLMLGDHMHIPHEPPIISKKIRIKVN